MGVELVEGARPGGPHGHYRLDALLLVAEWHDDGRAGAQGLDGGAVGPGLQREVVGADQLARGVGPADQ